jgi:hypothetical protein
VIWKERLGRVLNILVVMVDRVVDSRRSLR